MSLVLQSMSDYLIPHSEYAFLKLSLNLEAGKQGHRKLLPFQRCKTKV